MIPASLAAVVDTRRSTTLAEGAARIAMVEHLLAACHTLGIWSDLVVECDQEELPILDGSSAPYAEALATLDLSGRAPAPWVVAEPLRYVSGRTVIEFLPGQPELEVAIDFPHPAIGAQRIHLRPEHFHLTLSARTFALEGDLASLQALGLAQGAAPGRGILFTDEGPSEPLHSADEPVRHKALDAIGDFHLLGQPLGGRVRVDQGSHHAHIAALRQFVALERR
jgi:UDP-3-O-[3-hydroxymyristoyl] N-acetylglucosamine deacetylase